MLNPYEISDLHEFKQQIEDERIKELLNRVLFEYEKYIAVGTPEYCQQLREYMSYSPIDYLKAIDNMRKLVRDFYEPIEPKKKRGRPRKNKESVKVDAEAELDRIAQRGGDNEN